ncbi:SET and MYND domain-containing protein 4 isoform X2 [Centropristis striata]|uniref:SET and MYND domain-containing protein 4 isoform X2 n=1 Tax=Centropristis striata TaxID=184440 RepID=UPI0027DEE8BA|nr:SET and MYND domain-containing protein 4 isoform X2 [Centropristis striata]
MMDLPLVQWQEHVAQRWSGLDPELKEKFTSLHEVDDVFKCSLTLTTQDDVDFLQSISAGHSVQKDAEQAAKCRERGNCSFKSRDYTAAALHYSQGLCLSPLSSKQLSLCYANRSAALCHLQLYQDSLDDIDRALKNNYPSHLSHKLEDRRTQCLKHLSEGQRSREDHHSPATKNQSHPHGIKRASAGPLTFGICPEAAVCFSAEKGRHLVAAERIAAGEVILHDRPYSCVLIPGMEEVEGRRGRQEAERGMEHRRCHRCLTETLHPVPCDGCSYSRYCSNSCQRDAWEEHHRWECPLGAELIVTGVMSQLALRVTLKAGLKKVQMAREPIQEEHGDSCPCHLHYGDSYLSVFHLQHHLSHHSPGVRFLCALTVAALYLKLSRAGPPSSWELSRTSETDSQSQDQEGGTAEWCSELWLLGSAVLRHMLQLRCNAQAFVTLQHTGAANSLVQSSREIRIATAIFPTLSLLNHSCCPNTSLVFSTGTSEAADCSDTVAESSSTDRGVTVTVRAAKAISPGQEILHCYGPHSSRMATQERQRLLQEQYYFLCQCEACTLQQQQEEEGSEAGGSKQSGLLCGKCKGSLKASCGHRLSSFEVSRQLQEIRVDLEKAVDLMERERPDEVLRLLRRTQSPSGLILAETHPVQGELEDATARAYATMGDWKNAASHLERSAAAVGSQYGEDSIELGRQLFKLAQLHFNGGARGSALSVIPKVRRLLCLHSGPLCHELQELQAMEDCLRGYSRV